MAPVKGPSGTYYYKPDIRNSCCPQYAIRLEVALFKSSRDQRQALNRWNKYLLGPDYISKAARDKKWLRNNFDLGHSVCCSENESLPKPLDPKSKEHIRPAHDFKVNLEPDKFTEEKFLLFKNFQKNVHREKDSEISRDGFKFFLCSGLKQSTTDDNGKEKKLGSYHQCYRLDGKLVAMGVLDFLPHCVSSVYLMYHQDVKDWELGKLSALREILLATEGGYGYYYMGESTVSVRERCHDQYVRDTGYYIHSCTKMRYKATYHPQYLLDPETYTWDALNPDLLARLNLRKYVSLSRERRLNIPAEPLPTPDIAEYSVNDPPPPQENERSGDSSWLFSDYVDAQQGLASNPFLVNPRSIFEAKTAGAMTVEEVERDISLGEWRVNFQDMEVQLQDLVGWDESEMWDSHSWKGMAAQLAALLGPELVRETIITFS
ncbi:MAG: Arginyl-tRNA--protein transferase 1 [Heterodermia speciosa]|uniref:arginyltransferase n=1 Tax=Heterodermia speciosa TaxID=116794 RepID=A0A8H3FTL5_9LECA|nr:MAG: Arginyl-tRNA--protein transferase 1 [Heterodermia speciosa]